MSVNIQTPEGLRLIAGLADINDDKYVKLPTDESGDYDFGEKGFFAVSDGNGGITWTDEGGGGGGVSLNEPTNVSVTGGDETVTLQWTDPEDIVLESITLARWAGTVIVRKIDSPPTSKNDGDIIYDSLIRNQFSSTGYVDNTVQNDVTYFYGIFPYTDGHTYTTSCRKEVTPTATPATPPTNIKVSTKQNSATVDFDIEDDITRYTVVIKKGSSPASPSDGQTSTSKPAVFTDLEFDTIYYAKVYTYNSKGRMNTADAVQFTPRSFRVMTVKIDQSDSNPETCCTYADDAVGMTPGSDEWDDFFGHYPVLLKDGQEVGKLNRNNRSQFEDGSPADISSGNAGDAMICFPKLGIKINTVGDVVSVSVTDNPDAQSDGFEYNAHTVGNSIKDKFYTGIFKGYKDGSNKLRSLSGKAPTVNTTIGNFRTYAHNTGTGYEQVSYYRLLFRQCLYLLKYKNLDSQTAVGRGYADGNSAAINTGGTVAKSMDYGETTGKLQCSCLGIEDFWGNVYEFIDGIWVDSSRNITIGTTNFNDTGSGYTNAGSSGFTSDTYGYIDKVQGDTKKGFIIKSKNGSTTTYYCDNGDCYASRMGYFGGSWNGASSAGAFLLDLDQSASYSYSDVGGRLEFCA